MKKLNIQNIFCFISILFIISCFAFYGTRFIKLYLENKKEETVEANTLAKTIKNNNTENDNFKSVNGSNYFIDDDKSNYLIYSNIVWRIIKVNSDNSITAISDKSLTSLAFGKNMSFNDSYINKWLNTNSESIYSGILEKSLNKIDNYLQKTSFCLDDTETVNNDPCKQSNNDYYISLLSTADYLNVGGKNSYLINDEIFYLNNTTKENKIWFVSDDGKVNNNIGTDIIGIRPVITLKANVEYVSGDGTKNKPYYIEKENNYFGSYVLLDNQEWRIYQVNDTEVRLMLNDYLKVNNTNLTYRYSYNSSYHDDYKSGSIAYYLNKTFLNTLSYKDKIKEVDWSNGYYGSTNNYNYEDSLNKTIKSKVALMSVGNIFLNNELSNYFTMTGSVNKGTMVYTIQSNKKIFTKQIEQELNVVPVISVDKSLITKGNGTNDSPYEME